MPAKELETLQPLNWQKNNGYCHKSLSATHQKDHQHVWARVIGIALELRNPSSPLAYISFPALTPNNSRQVLNKPSKGHEGWQVILDNSRSRKRSEETCLEVSWKAKSKKWGDKNLLISEWGPSSERSWEKGGRRGRVVKFKATSY